MYLSPLIMKYREMHNENNMNCYEDFKFCSSPLCLVRVEESHLCIFSFTLMS
ncbi:uncharacterized protein MELLADRAFT_95017 [Melampsora larici-populina 98AG31]|uniref:Uncharacterized protein n=1 Tax=Melampsora larici-populina (strain 98AG31 / pathotype 3-4-7) TaxID=747676 RepID=F4S8T9_MELLP|nr:uncharacterized protein MELLADRAFT_95017 [Melampsora larici-populina 98AG31]EGF98965.1 hypothetical protein MELLADRAFT_95017 [Melampsora larici-populina 98AG31]